MDMKGFSSSCFFKVQNWCRGHEMNWRKKLTMKSLLQQPAAAASSSLQKHPPGEGAADACEGRLPLGDPRSQAAGPPKRSLNGSSVASWQKFSEQWETVATAAVVHKSCDEAEEGRREAAAAAAREIYVAENSEGEGREAAALLPRLTNNFSEINPRNFLFLFPPELHWRRRPP